LASDSGDLGDLQFAVMKVLWECGSATVRDVVEALPSDRSRAYTTVLTVLRSLEKREIIRHDATDGARMYRYSPLITEGEVRDQAIHDLVERYFNGSAGELLRYLVETDSASETDPGPASKTRNRKAPALSADSVS
jgi:predicted transcriptional regulator